MLVIVLYVPEDRIIEAGKEVRIFYSEWMVKQTGCRKERLGNTFFIIRKSNNMILYILW